MRELIENSIRWFGLLTGLEDAINQGMPWIIGALSIIALAACFFGIKIYRIIFSGLLFIGTCVLCCLLWKDRYPWLYVAATFSIVGVTLAFIGFRWKKLGAVLVCALEGCLLAYLVGNPLVVIILFGMLDGLFVFWFPVIGLIVFQSVCGSFLFVTLQENILWFPNFQVPFLIVMGMLLQWFISQRIEIFDEPYPKWMRRR
ncbi:Uncharacterised protein [uncultured Eubacterium sp.]|nr:Uncharacterised protein [uncultured Eubacterium sp.]